MVPTVAATSFAEQLGGVVGHDVPGIAVAVVGPEGVRSSAAVGFRDLSAAAPASTLMVCPWFSMTKIATATTAMRLVERQVLDLDEPLIRMVSALRVLRPAELAERITSRHLLSHSSGISNPIPIRWIHPADEPSPDADLFLEDLLAKHRNLRFEPGSHASYSNLGVLVLGKALSTATRRPFTELVAGELLVPLGMAQTGFAYSPQMELLAATGYHPRWSPMRLLMPGWALGPSIGRWVSLRRFLLDGAPYGGLVGSLDDACRFLQFHLGDGEINGTRLLTAESVRAMQAVHSRGGPTDFGLGWCRPAKRSTGVPDFVEHLGGGAGFFNLLRIYTSRRVGVVVIGNATHYDIDAVTTLGLQYA